jgi:uncharacterized iron-regulated membrane protein
MAINILQNIYVRRTVRRLHLWLGLASGIVLLIVALTGCLLAFENEIRDATQHRLLYVEKEAGGRLGIDSIRSIVWRYDKKLKLTQVRYYGDGAKAVHCYTKDKKILSLNPYTGAVLGLRDTERDWLSVVLSLHRTLLLGKAGEAIIFCNVWIFLVMLVSGMILWLPRRWKQWRQGLTIKKNASAKRRNYDLHSVLGFYAWLPLLLIAITGIDMATGGRKEAKLQSQPLAGTGGAKGKGIYDQAIRQVVRNEPIEVLRVNLPQDSLGVIGVNIRYRTRGLRRQEVYSFDRYSGQLLKTDSYQNKSFRRRFFGSDYELHTGQILGLPGKLIMFLAALVAASLPVTGFLMWRGKRKKNRIVQQPLGQMTGSLK